MKNSHPKKIWTPRGQTRDREARAHKGWRETKDTLQEAAADWTDSARHRYGCDSFDLCLIHSLFWNPVLPCAFAGCGTCYSLVRADLGVCSSSSHCSGVTDSGWQAVPAQNCSTCQGRFIVHLIFIFLKKPLLIFSLCHWLTQLWLWWKKTQQAAQI